MGLMHLISSLEIIFPREIFTDAIQERWLKFLTEKKKNLGKNLFIFNNSFYFILFPGHIIIFYYLSCRTKSLNHALPTEESDSKKKVRVHVNRLL